MNPGDKLLSQLSPLANFSVNDIFYAISADGTRQGTVTAQQVIDLLKLNPMKTIKSGFQLNPTPSGSSQIFNIFKLPSVVTGGAVQIYSIFFRNTLYTTPSASSFAIKMAMSDAPTTAANFKLGTSSSIDFSALGKGHTLYLNALITQLGFGAITAASTAGPGTTASPAVDDSITCASVNKISGSGLIIFPKTGQDNYISIYVPSMGDTLDATYDVTIYWDAYDANGSIIAA